VSEVNKNDNDQDPVAICTASFPFQSKSSSRNDIFNDLEVDIFEVMIRDISFYDLVVDFFQTKKSHNSKSYKSLLFSTFDALL